MPSDELFAGGPGPAPEPEPPVEPPAEPIAPAAPSLTMEQVEARISAATSPLQRENDALKLAIAQSQQPAPTHPSGDDFVQSFNKDPQAAVKAIADQASSEGLRQLAPHLQTLIGSANSAFLNGEQTRIEDRFGAKAWQEVYQPILTDRFAQIRRENPFAVADINRVRQEVDIITGANFEKLATLRDEHLKGRSTATEAERNKLIEDARRGITTNLTGGIRTNPKGATPELDPDLKAAIADMDRHTGRKTNTAEWTKNMINVQNSKDVDEWLANTKPAGRA